MTTRKPIRALALTCLIPLCGANFLCAQKPATERGTGARVTPVSTTHGHRYVVAIGINRYAHWPILSTAVNDATGFATLLQTNFGYEQAVPPLTEKDATRSAIVSLIDDSLRAKLQPDDDLVIFFAGHGTTRVDKIGNRESEVGFLVPYEAQAPSAAEKWSDYIQVDEFLRTVNSLPARHILVILDSCHSGLALGSAFSSSRGVERYQADIAAKLARKVIASAQGQQTASDRGPIPGHSLFTGVMIDGLKKGEVDAFRQGFFTASQLGLYVQSKVSSEEGSHQTPMFGGFSRDDEGDLLLPTKPGGKLPDLSASALAPPPPGPPGTDRGAPVPASAPVATSSAALDDLEIKLDGFSARADGVNKGIASLQRSIPNLRTDILAKQSSLNTNLTKAKAALTARDADRATRFTDLTETDLKALEKFLGR